MAMTIEELAKKHGITVKSAEMHLGIGVTHTYVPDKNEKPGYYSTKAPRKSNRYHSRKARNRSNRNDDIPDLI